MKNKKNLFISLAFFFSLIFLSCSNFFHSLLPPQDNDLITFQVQYENGNRSNTQSPDKDNNITIIVPDETDITNLIPIVNISEKAEIIPGTLPYLNQMFPGYDLLSLAAEMQKARSEGTFIDWFVTLLLENKDFDIPKLNTPIDFSTSVPFYVISGQGTYQIYTVTVITEAENVKLENSPYDPSKTEKNILSFEVTNQIGSSIIDNTNCTVEFEISPDENINSILPKIVVSDGAKPLPLTQSYLQACNFSFAQILDFYTGFSTATDLNRYISLYFQKQEDLSLPSISIPMDFSSGITIAVIAGDRSAKIYTVTAKVDDTLPFISEFSIGKSKNLFLMKDAEVSILTNGIYATVLYPVEIEIDYCIVPDIVFTGDKITYTINGGSEIDFVSGETEIPFTKYVSKCTFTVYSKTTSVEYKFILERLEDPDTIRSITDYRFRKVNNSEIKSNVIASIYNEGELGLITATVLYEGNSCPYELIPEFITPGILTLNGEEQISGVTKNSFEYSAEYLCTSKNGLYCRVYTIKIDFIQVLPAQTIIKSFTFSDYLNSGITQTANAVIDELSKTIRCEIEYFTQDKPFNLVPQFSATGPVYVSNIEQTSGFSCQNFEYAKYYTVKSEEDSSVTKTYKVEIMFKQDPASACELTSFGFLQQDNQTLTKDVEARITQRDLSVFALMPYASGTKEGIEFIQYFTAEGNVTVNGQSQISRVNAQDFSNEVIYTVTSVNGLYKKDYKVILQESGDVIYVDINAVGRNNGTSWADAFINLELAFNQADLMGPDVPAEIWVASREGQYSNPNSKTQSLIKFNTNRNIVLRGGFKGTESSIDEREKDEKGLIANKTTIFSDSDSVQYFYDISEHTNLESFFIEGFTSSKNFNFLDQYRDVDTLQNQVEFIVEDCSFSKGKIALGYSKKNQYRKGVNLQIKNCYFGGDIQNFSAQADSDTSIIDNFYLTIENSTFDSGKISLLCKDAKNAVIKNCTFITDILTLNLNTEEFIFENNDFIKKDYYAYYETNFETGEKTFSDKVLIDLEVKGKGNLNFENINFAEAKLLKSVYNTTPSANFSNCLFIGDPRYGYAPKSGSFNEQFYIGTEYGFYTKGNTSSTLTNCNIMNCEIYVADNCTSVFENCNFQSGNYNHDICCFGNTTIIGGSYNVLSKYSGVNFYGYANIKDAKFNIDCYIGENFPLFNQTINYNVPHEDRDSHILEMENVELIMNKNGKGTSFIEARYLNMKDCKIILNSNISDHNPSYGINSPGGGQLTDNQITFNGNFDVLACIKNTNVKNTSIKGNAIKSLLYCDNSTFEDCEIISNTKVSNVLVDYGNTTFTNCYIKGESNSIIFYDTDYQYLTFIDSNVDTKGHQFFYSESARPNLTIQDSNVNCNVEFSFIYEDGGQLSISNSKIEGVSLNGDFIFCRNLNITDRSNVALQSGGNGILCRYGDLEISDSTLNITSKDDGIYSSSDLTIDNCSMNISASADGIYSSLDLTIDNCSMNISASADGMYCNKYLITNSDIKIIQFGDIGINTSSGDSIIEGSKISIDSNTLSGYLGCYFAGSVKNCQLYFYNKMQFCVGLGEESTLINSRFYFQNRICDDGSGEAIHMSLPCTIKDCFFSGAKNTIVENINDEVFPRGALFNLYISTSESFIFENCTFSDNKILGAKSFMSGGGAFGISFEANNSFVRFKNCKFIGNSSSSNNGHHIWASANWANGNKYSNCKIIFEDDVYAVNPDFSSDAIYVNNVTISGL